MFEHELQLLLQKYPEIEDVSYTHKKLVKREVIAQVVSPQVIQMPAMNTNSISDDEATRIEMEAAIKLKNIQDFV